MNLNAMLVQWKMARTYGAAGDLVKETLGGSWERLWRCGVRGHHREKFASHGACYRCGKPLR